MGKRLALFLISWALVLIGGGIAYKVQTADGVRIEDVRYPGDAGETLSALLYIPPGASAQHPAPAVLAAHGFINTREMQSPFAIELARRGFVVLAMDMTGHGYSGGVLAQDGFGGPASLKYLRALPYVDKANIGLEGHSMGGSPVMFAAGAIPDGYKSVVLEGSTTGFFGAPQGAATFPRNLELVFGQYDEFAGTMWQVPKGSQVGAAPRLQALFGTKAPIVPGQLYGDLTAETGRMLVNPAIDHPQEHFSDVGVSAAIDWFQRTLQGEAAPKPPSEQVWFGKEIGTAIGFIGCVLLILATFDLALSWPIFVGLAQTAQPAAVGRGPRWWLAFALTAAIPALTYYPLMQAAPAIFFAPFAATGTIPFALRTFPEQITDQLLVWALITGLISLALSWVLKSGKPAFSHRWLPALGAAVVSVGMGYVALLVVDAVFKVDFRFWVLGLKPLDGRHFALFGVYLIPFTLFFLMALRGYAASLPLKGEGEIVALGTGKIAFALGFAVMLAIQYLHMASTGLLLDPSQALNTIIAFQFVPILAVIGLFAAFTYRRTNSYFAGAFVCGLFVTWYIVAGTAIFPPTLSALAPPKAKPAPAAAVSNTASNAAIERPAPAAR